MDDLFTMVLFGIFILFGLLSAARKKKSPPGPSPGRPRRPRTVAPPRPRVPRSPTGPVARTGAQRPRTAPPTPPTPARPGPESTGRGLAEELFDLLRGQVEQIEDKPVIVEPPEPVAEARSLETLEPEGRASHQRFHDLYVDETPTPPPGRVEVRRRFRLGTSRQRLRDAIVMNEILGPPKGLG